MNTAIIMGMRVGEVPDRGAAGYIVKPCAECKADTWVGPRSQTYYNAGSLLVCNWCMTRHIKAGDIPADVVQLPHPPGMADLPPGSVRELAERISRSIDEENRK